MIITSSKAAFLLIYQLLIKKKKMNIIVFINDNIANIYIYIYLETLDKKVQ